MVVNGHPISTEKRRQFTIDEARVSHAILSWKIEDDKVIGTIQTTHPMG